MTEQMHVKPEISDELIKGYKNPEDFIGEHGLLKQLTKALLERAMKAEMTHHLGYEKGDQQTVKTNGNRRRRTLPRKPLRAKTANCKSPFRETAMPVLNRRLLRNAPVVLTASTI